MNLPDKVRVIEVGPRDGFQNISTFIPTDTKLDVISSLLDANIRELEITSFVHPQAIPQMKDAAEVAGRVRKMCDRLELIALVPNLTGARAAREVGIGKVTYVISASWKHNQENVRRTIEESFAELKALRINYPEMKIRLAVATAFGCPYLGNIPIEQVIGMIENGLNLQVDEILLCDTIGTANPRQMHILLGAVKEKYPGIEFGLHLHDTRGMGLANVLAALQQGFTIFEAAVGGLGGCPFAPGAAGNIATEDLVNMLEQMGIKTGIDLDKLLKAARIVKDKINPALTGHMINILSDC